MSITCHVCCSCLFAWSKVLSNHPMQTISLTLCCNVSISVLLPVKVYVTFGYLRQVGPQISALWSGACGTHSFLPLIDCFTWSILYIDFPSLCTVLLTSAHLCPLPLYC